MIEIKSTLKQAPIRLCIFGRDGVGKSTFCAGAPGAVFVAVESGLDNIDARATAEPTNWTEILEFVQALAEDTRCETIVIDSLDWAEQLCWAYVCDQGDSKGRKQKSITGFGYGDGYTAALSQWRILLNELSRARTRGKNVLLIAHAERKAVKNPTGEDYEAWQIKLNAKAAGLIREWVDVVGFAELDIAVIEGKGTERAKGISTGKRVLRTQPAAGYDSKTRFNLPERMPLDWPSFARLVREGRPATVAELEATLASKLEALGDPIVAKGCADFLDGRGKTFASLSEAIVTVDDYLSKKESK